MLFLPLLACVSFGGGVVPATVNDTTRSIDIEEAVVVAQPKETSALRTQAVSASIFDGETLSRRGVTAAKDLTSLSPGFFMPDYGSRLTSAVYVRGIGSRINAPSVGLYVDNVPLSEKTAYDFTFSDVERVDILRGPQGTLYGAGAMGGVMRVFTADPFTHRGGDVRLGWTSKTNARRASLTGYLHPAERLAISLNGYYTDEKDGFNLNQYNHEPQDASRAGGGRMHLAWRPSNVVRIDWTAHYEYSDEDACPYVWTSTRRDSVSATGNISQNRPSRYRRSLFNTGLSVMHHLPRLVLTSTTAYSHTTDRYFMDQDFTSADIFSLLQKQKVNSLSEEIALKSRDDAHSRHTWTSGAYVNYRTLRTDCPVTFYGGGVDYLNNMVAENLPSSPQIGITFTGSEIPFNARFSTPSLGAALFHQSTVRIVGQLYATLGLRLAYDHHHLRMNSGAGTDGVPYHFAMSMGQRMSFDTDLAAQPSLSAVLNHDTWQALPKAALSYRLRDGIGNIYISVSKGYRMGGYNVQSYSDLSQSLLRRQMMNGVRDYSIETINAIPYLPDAAKQGAIAGLTSVMEKITPAQPDAQSLYYKPEYTWSYEWGLHHNLLGKMLQIDLAAFYMKTRNVQISRFAADGMGRETVNAGRSRSLGVEISLRSSLLAERLSLAANYGYADARFTHYDLGTSSDGTTSSYDNNRVPFAPRHTFSASADFRQPLSGDLLRAVSVGVDVKGAGNVYWDEANTFSQPIYATLGARIGLELAADLSVEIWGHNLTNSHYATFSFESMNNRFAQYGNPRCVGADLRWHF